MTFNVATRDGKLALFKHRFRSRLDAYARRFKRHGSKKWEWVKATERKSKEDIPVTDDIYTTHLTAARDWDAMAVYPLIPDTLACAFVCADFDDHNGSRDPKTDVRRFCDVLDVQSVPHLVELSQSGNGYHVWIFFASFVRAAKAVAVTYALLTEAQVLAEGSTLATYDRIFPMYASVGKKGYSNAIALPLRGDRWPTACVFVDVAADLAPFDKEMQWDRLRDVGEVPDADLDRLVAALDVDLATDDERKRAREARGGRKRDAAEPRTTGNSRGRRSRGSAPKGGLYACAQTALATGIPPGKRHDGVFKLASHLRNAGIPETVAHSMVAQTLIDHSPDADRAQAQENVSGAYSGEFTGLGCEFWQGIGYCNTSCPVILRQTGDEAPKTAAAAPPEATLPPVDGTGDIPDGPAAPDAPEGGALAVDAESDSAPTDASAPPSEPPATPPAGTPPGDDPPREPSFDDGPLPTIHIRYSYEDVTERASGYAHVPAGDDGEIKRISNFLLRPTRVVSMENNEDDHIVCDIERATTRIVSDAVIPRRAFNSKKEFKGSIKDARAMWYGSDDDTQKVLGVLDAYAVPRSKGTRKLGRTEAVEGRHVIVAGKTTCITAEGIVEGTNAPVCYVNEDQRLASMLHFEEAPIDRTRAVVRDVCEHLLNVNRRTIMWTVAAWGAASAFKPLIHKRREADGFPILCVWGTLGSGKTHVIRDVLWPMCGVRGDLYSIFTTPFSRLRLLSSTTTIPIPFDEFRTWGKSAHDGTVDEVSRLLRLAYVGGDEPRGRPDQTLNHYTLTSPIVLIGEALPSDPAVRERILVAHLSPADIQVRPGATLDEHALIASRTRSYRTLAASSQAPTRSGHCRWTSMRCGSARAKSRRTCRRSCQTASAQTCTSPHSVDWRFRNSHGRTALALT